MTDDQEFSVDSAREAADRGELREWVAEFLGSPGSDNADLADQLAEQRPYWLGPVRLRFNELHRLAGPPDAPVLDRFDDDESDYLDDMEDSLDDGWNPPPLIVSSRGDQLVVEDGNHRVEGLRRSGRHHYWALVCFENEADVDRFVEDPEHAG